MLIVGIIVASAILIVLIAFFRLKNHPPYITSFIKENPNRSSIYLIRNDKVILAHNENKLMPLASTVKIIIALEYANQVSKNVISKEEPIDLNELNKFYLPNTDAGAHNGWLKEVASKQLIQNNSVSLEEVVKGMIKFSSNANAEYMIAKLGKDNLDSCIKKEELNHTPIYPFVSSLIVCSEFPGLSGSDCILKSWEYHERLKNGESDLLQSFKIPKLPVQKIWSDKLPASTTKDYCTLMNKINTETLADKKVSQHLKEILGWPLENSQNQKHSASFGIKGGSTAFIVTEALYATDASGNTSALAVFFNDLKDWEKVIIDFNLTKFELKVLLDEKFRNAVKEKL